MVKRKRIPSQKLHTNSTAQNVLCIGETRRYYLKHQQWNFTPTFIYTMVALCVAAQLQICSSFHMPATWTKSARPVNRITQLQVVESKQRTEYLQHTVPHLDLGTETSFDPLVMNASSEERQQFEDQDQPGEEESNENESENEEARAERLDRAAKAAALLSRRSGNKPSGTAKTRDTSVGARRIGSASQARTGTRSVSRLSDAIRKAAAATAKDQGNGHPKEEGPSAKVSKSLIQATVESMMQSTSSMGLFGEADHSAVAQDPRLVQHPTPGTVLVPAERSTRPWKAAERVSVRVASMADDLDIANLRLSVFSDFSSDMRRAFCAKSCQVLSTRRNRGATCIVATVPRYGSLMSPRPDIILGTAECSFHEFEGTTLGRRRLLDSILYTTEVAVNPTARRKGIGQKLMKSIDELANIRGIETIFLHVDTTNYGAMHLYKQAGYCLVPANEPMFEEFTRSLNLHDGATKGRNHFLLMKDLQQPTWLPDRRVESQHRETFGFEIPA